MYVKGVWMCRIGSANSGIHLCSGGRLGARGGCGVGRGSTLPVVSKRLSEAMVLVMTDDAALIAEVCNLFIL